MMTPLHAASASGHLSVIQHLLEVGADASAVDMEGNTPVHDACLNGQDVVLAAILSSSNVSTATLVNAMNKAGQTPLHFAGRLSVSAASPLCFRDLSDVFDEIDLRRTSTQNDRTLTGISDTNRNRHKCW